MVPYHCLGSIWSQRDKKGKEHLAPTVRATVTQFNSVANCVITTCLGDRNVTARDRARVVEHWIEVARVCPGGPQGAPFFVPPTLRAVVCGPGSRGDPRPIAFWGAHFLLRFLPGLSSDPPPLVCYSLGPGRALPGLPRHLSCPGGEVPAEGTAAGAGGGPSPLTATSPLPRSVGSSRTSRPSTPSSPRCRATRSTG